MQDVRTTGVGLYVAGERHSAWLPKFYKPGTKYLVLYCPPKGQSGINVYTDFQAAAIVAAGFPLVSADLGNLDGSTPQWANDLAMSRLDSLWTWAKANLGCKTDGVLIFGGSHGGLTAINWAKRHTDIVRAVAASIPVMNLPHVHDNNVGTSAAGIETVYGGAASWAANVVGHSPSELASSMGNVPIKIWHADGDSDPFTPTHFYTEFAAACSSCVLRSGGPVGHITTWIPNAELQSFLLANS